MLSASTSNGDSMRMQIHCLFLLLFIYISTVNFLQRKCCLTLNTLPCDVAVVLFIEIRTLAFMCCAVVCHDAEKFTPGRYSNCSQYIAYMESTSSPVTSLNMTASYSESFMHSLSRRIVPSPQRFSIQSRKYAVASYPASHFFAALGLQCGGTKPVCSLTKSIRSS